MQMTDTSHVFCGGKLGGSRTMQLVNCMRFYDTATVGDFCCFFSFC